MTLPRPLGLLARVLASFVLLYCGYLVGTRAIAEWHFRQASPEGLRKAIQWDPRNPMYYSALGRVLQNSASESDLGEVIRLYEKATQLSPYAALYWAELGGAYEIVGRARDAQRAYERAQVLFPNSPAINWQLGNFYIRQGDTERALPALRKVLLGDPRLQEQAFDLVWRAGADPELLLKEMIPRDAAILFNYLAYLCRKKRITEAGQVWAEILASQLPFEPKAAFLYLDSLVLEHRVEELTAAWKVLSGQQATPMTQLSADSNLVTNGGFESTILNGGLDWRVNLREGVVVSVDNLNFFDGTRSLMIQFDGKQNLDYHDIYQLVPVTPNTFYQFMGYMKTREVTTDTGLRFEFYDALDPSRQFLSTQDLTGTASWTPQQLRFRTTPETKLLVIRLRRPPSSKFDNKIQGTAWIDRISLNPAE